MKFTFLQSCRKKTYQASINLKAFKKDCKYFLAAIIDKQADIVSWFPFGAFLMELSG